MFITESRDCWAAKEIPLVPSTFMAVAQVRGSLAALKSHM